MLIDWTLADTLLATRALTGYAKGLAAAAKACEKVHVDTVAVETADGEAEKAMKWLVEQDTLAWTPGDVRAIDVPYRTAFCLRLALSVHLSDLDRLAGTELDLLSTTVTETKDRQSQARSLSDRLSGQTEIPDLYGVTQSVVDASAPDPSDDTSATISVNGSKPIPMEQLERGVEALAASKVRR